MSPAPAGAASASEYQVVDRLFLWSLLEPARPTPVGELNLLRSSQRVSLRQYQLTPAFDVLPSGQSLGFQQMRVGEQAADSTLLNALSMCTLFGLKHDAAVREAREVAAVVSGWKEHFAGCGVTRRDVD
jgi:hypothetical protein